MDRKNFLKKSMIGLGTVVALPAVASSCSDKDNGINSNAAACELSPRETAGPFPNKTPAQLARENIISDRTGVPLLITLTVTDQRQDCNPLPGVLVDIWHCDARGNYSQYNDQTNKDYLRGRQTTIQTVRFLLSAFFPAGTRGAPRIFTWKFRMPMATPSGLARLLSQLTSVTLFMLPVIIMARRTHKTRMTGFSLTVLMAIWLIPFPETPQMAIPC